MPYPNRMANQDETNSLATSQRETEDILVIHTVHMLELRTRELMYLPDY